MRRISANYIAPVSSPPIKNGIIETEDNGTIRKIYDFNGEMRELPHTEFLNGILVPGLINMHTHIELSWMKQINSSNQGLINFIERLSREKTPANSEIKIASADDFMYRRGIVGACDISNTSISIRVKKQSKIRYHTMVETYELQSEKAQKQFELAKKILKRFQKQNLSASIAPHAPYSISETLWKMLRNELSDQFVSIHNQECEHENSMFISGNGKFIKRFKLLGYIDPQWKPTGISSLQSVIKHLLNSRLLLVHNIYTSHNDIEKLTKVKPYNTGLVFCPTSNIHIEGKLPSIEILSRNNLPKMLGTDSTASGKSLSLLDEMICLQKKTNLAFEELLRWGTLNAANFMNWSDFGSFDIGKCPGINLISHFDFENFKLTPNSTIRKVI